MRNLCLLFVALSSTLLACGGSSRTSTQTAGVASNSANSGVSFGIYDISSSSPMSGAADLLTTRIGSEEPEKQSVADRKAKTPATSPPSSSANPLPIDRPQQIGSIDRKVIRNADLDLESDSPENVQRQITTIAETNGGFVVESQQSSSDITSSTRDIVTMTLRVPADKFNDALDQIRKAAGRIVTENVKGQDVTEEFIDIESELKAKRALEAQFLEIMKRADSVQEAMDVQSQLAGVRADIEKIEGRRRFLENQSELSTIKVRVQTPKVFAANSAGFMERLGDSFGSGLDFAMNFVLGLVAFVVGVLPFAVFIGLPGFLIFRYLWKRQTRPRSIAEIAEEEIRND